jgi:TPR repeat protein
MGLFHRSAALGDEGAQLHLARIYRDGRGVAQDDEKAELWFGVAAAQGKAEAQADLDALGRSRQQQTTPSPAQHVSEEELGEMVPFCMQLDNYD